MDPLQWVLEKKPGEAHVAEVSQLEKTLAVTSDAYRALWMGSREKQGILKEIDQRGIISLLPKIGTINERMQRAITWVLAHGPYELIKKILFEGVEKLHEIESWLQGETSGQRNPHQIEYGKRAFWRIIQNESTLQDFIEKVAQGAKPLFDEFRKTISQLSDLLASQSRDCKGNIWVNQFAYAKQEEELLQRLQFVLRDIINRMVNMARTMKGLASEDLRFTGDILNESAKTIQTGVLQAGKKRVKVMLVHAITGSPDDFRELQLFLESKGYLVYNVRLPGHGTTIGEDFNTHFDEWENFIIKAMKYFYSYQKAPRDPNQKNPWLLPGRFYLIGVSMGAMIPFHILAKSWMGKNPRPGNEKELYPYQGLVKGFIPMGTCIFPAALPRASILRTPLQWMLASRNFSRVMDKIARTGVSKSFVDEAIAKVMVEMKKEDKSPEVYNTEFQGRVKFIIRPKFLRDAKKRNKVFLKTKLPGGSVISNKPGIRDAIIKRHFSLGRTTINSEDIFTDEELEKEVDETVAISLNNISLGRKGLGTGTVIDSRSLLNRNLNQFYFMKKFPRLIELMWKLRSDAYHIQIPSLMIHGLHDGLAHFDSSIYMMDHFHSDIPLTIPQGEVPEKTLLLLKKTGHLAVMEGERGIVFDEIYQFVERTEHWDAKVRLKKINEQREQIAGMRKKLPSNPQAWENFEEANEPSLVK